MDGLYSSVNDLDRWGVSVNGYGFIFIKWMCTLIINIRDFFCNYYFHKLGRKCLSVLFNSPHWGKFKEFLYYWNTHRIREVRGDCISEDLYQMPNLYGNFLKLAELVCKHYIKFKCLKNHACMIFFL